MRLDLTKESVQAIKDELRYIALHESDKNMDGFYTSKYKKDLMDIYWYIEDLLENCSTYTVEEEWIEEREKKKMMQILSGRKDGQN